MTDPGEIIVTQEDRDAAADLLALDLGEPLSPADLFQLNEIRSGLSDDDDGVLAFARHRLDSTQAQAGEVGERKEAGESELAKIMREIADDARVTGHLWRARHINEAADALASRDAEIASLQAQKAALVEALGEAVEMIERARDREYNPFEPSNQTKLHDDLCAFLARCDALLVVEGGGK